MTRQKDLGSYDTFCYNIPSYLIENEFYLEGKWRRLTNSELILAMIINHSLVIPRIKSQDCKTVKHPPFTVMSIAELSKKTGQSIRTVKRNRKALKDLGIITIKKRRVHQTDLVYFNNPSGIRMKEIISE